MRDPKSVRPADSAPMRRRMHPLWLLLAASTGLAACGGGEGAVAPLDPPPVPTRLLSVSGSGLQGKAGELLPAEFVVRAVNDRGEAVRGVPITWQVTSGRGRFRVGNQTVLRGQGSTDSEGLARIRFQPLVLGHSTVEALASPPSAGSATFTTEATSTVVHIWLWMVGPDDSSEIIVPVGSRVEWRNWLAAAQVASTSKPPSGSSFRSDRLEFGERFEFVPDAAGSWEFVDEISGIRGTLTAH